MNKRIRKKKGRINKEELYDLYFTLAKYILPRLKAFKQINKNSYPVEFNSIEEWHQAIDKMIFSFDFVKNNTIYTLDDLDTVLMKYNKGMSLFVKHFIDLWD